MALDLIGRCEIQVSDDKPDWRVHTEGDEEEEFHGF